MQPFRASVVLFALVAVSCTANRAGEDGPLQPVLVSAWPAVTGTGSPVPLSDGLAAGALRVEEPFAQAKVSAYSLPDLEELPWPQQYPDAILVLAERDGAQLAGVIAPDAFQTQAAEGPAISLAGTLATRLLLPRLLAVMHAQSAEPASRQRSWALMKALDEVAAAVAAVLVGTPRDLRLAATLAAVRAMPTGKGIRQLANEVVSLTPAWQAYARWLQQSHTALVANVQEGGIALPVAPWVVGEVRVDSPQISLGEGGEVTVRYQGNVLRAPQAAGTDAVQTALAARLKKLDRLLGNPLPQPAGGSGGRGTAAPQETEGDVTVLDGNLPAPTWEEP